MENTRGRGLVPFGAVMLMLVGAFNLLDGIVALANPDYLRESLLFSTLSAWGWFFIVFGGLQFLVGIAVLNGSEIALWPGIVLAGINAVAHLAYVRSNPAWSIAIIVLDVLVIYGFMAQGMALGIETVEPPDDDPAPAGDLGASSRTAV
jgi:hypothetical protein